MAKLYDGRVTLNRVILEGKRHVFAPSIQNSGPVAQLRPTSPDTIKVDPQDVLHVAAWRHFERRRWAQAQIRTEEDRRRLEAAQPRCEICGDVLINGGANTIGSGTKGRGRLCPPDADAINFEAARRRLETHRAAVEAWLEGVR